MKLPYLTSCLLLLTCAAGAIAQSASGAEVVASGPRMVEQPARPPPGPAPGSEMPPMPIGGAGSPRAGSTSSEAGGCGAGCQQMMEKEARFYPWKMGALGIFLSLLTVALLLLTILEYKWIRLTSLRIERERQGVGRGA